MRGGMSMRRCAPDAIPIRAYTYRPKVCYSGQLLPKGSRRLKRGGAEKKRRPRDTNATWISLGSELSSETGLKNRRIPNFISIVSSFRHCPSLLDYRHRSHFFVLSHLSPAIRLQTKLYAPITPFCARRRATESSCPSPPPRKSLSSRPHTPRAVCCGVMKNGTPDEEKHEICACSKARGLGCAWAQHGTRGRRSKRPRCDA